MHSMLANIVNAAVILAGREGRTVIKYHDLTRVRSREDQQHQQGF